MTTSKSQPLTLSLPISLAAYGFVDRGLQVLALADELAADVDEAGVRAHGEGGEQRALDQQMRIVPHDLAVLAGAGLALVGVDDEIGRARIGLGHERPLEARREAGAAAAAQARGLDLVDDPVVALVDQRLGAAPGAARARALEAPVLEAVEVAKDAVLVCEHRPSVFSDPLRRPLAFMHFSVVGPPAGHDACRPVCEPGLVGSPDLRA